MQSNVTVSGNKITGTLKKLTTGALPDYWGEGYFLALKFSNIDADATSVKVGLFPSAGSGLVELINDPDKNGAFKITDKATQKIKVVQSGAKGMTTQLFSLADLVEVDE